MQDRLDHTYTTFVNEMAQYRKVSPEKVHSDMADGKIFSGSKAIDAGLADGMMSFDDLLAMMRDKGRNKQSTMPSTQGSFVHTATGGETTQEEVQMTRAELNEKYPALFAEVFNEGQQAGVVTGASQERARIQSVLSIPGPLAAAHKDLVSQMAFDGKTSAEAAVYRLHTAAEEHRTTMAAAIQTGAVAPAPAAEAGEQSEEQKSVAMAVDHMVAGAAAYQSRQ